MKTNLEKEIADLKNRIERAKTGLLCAESLALEILALQSIQELNSKLQWLEFRRDNPHWYTVWNDGEVPEVKAKIVSSREKSRQARIDYRNNQ